MSRTDRRQPYHHGNLRAALLKEAVRVIRSKGVAALTLRSAGDALGVSRTALYRHFAGKSDLLAAVAAEGFRKLRGELEGKAFEDMGRAYVRFAVRNPSHYRVMFGGYIRNHTPGTELDVEGARAFQVLVDALTTMQKQGVARRDDPKLQAQFVWSVVHGVAMLTIDGQLRGPAGEECLPRRYVAQRIQSAVAPAQGAP